MTKEEKAAYDSNRYWENREPTYRKRNSGISTCRHCDVELEAGTNWAPSSEKKHDYTCHLCRSAHGKPYREANKEKMAERSRIWTQNNLGKHNARCARYRARRLGQTPEDADMEAIEKLYIDRPDGYEVDHIVPLSKGGLHHQDNLQYLTVTENRTKGARL